MPHAIPQEAPPMIFSKPEVEAAMNRTMQRVLQALPPEEQEDLLGLANLLVRQREVAEQSLDKARLTIQFLRMVTEALRGRLKTVEDERGATESRLRLGEAKGKGKEKAKAQTDIAVQTSPPTACDVATDPLPTLLSPTMPVPAKTYAEAAMQASRSITTPVRKQQRGKHATTGLSTPHNPPPQARTLVMHAAPLMFKPGTMRRWIEEDNKGTKILGICWLLKEDRRGKAASSLVIYLKDKIEVGVLRMGRRLFRTTHYDWNR